LASISTLSLVQNGLRSDLVRGVAIRCGHEHQTAIEDLAKQIPGERCAARAAIDEAMEAFAERVKIKWLSTVTRSGANEIVVEQMEMLPDGSG